MLLIRHGHTDAVGQRLVSRLPGVALSDAGRSEVERLREVLHSEHIRAIYSSPLERAIETAKPIAADHGLPMLQCDGLIEVEFGEWTGKTFDELKHRTDWRRFNEQRGSAAVPGGETAATVQARIVTCLDRLRVTHAGRTIAAVSHADVIRAALLRYTGTPLDDWQRIDIEPASVSAVSLCADGAKVLYVNRRPPLV